MKRRENENLKLKIKLGLFLVMQFCTLHSFASTLSLSNVPLFLTSNSKANVLMMYGNSNSMDSDPSGKAVGSANAASKSEIARAAIKSVVSNYTGSINMGLLAYQQSGISNSFLHDSQYDASYNPINYDANYTGKRNGLTKKFRIPNPSSANNFLYFNVNLPFYSGSNEGIRFCYAATACTDPNHDFNGTSQSACASQETPVSGPWDNYTCYITKTGTSDAAPGSPGAGYSNQNGGGTFSSTDSDYGQGITDFGKFLLWQYVGPTWFVNTSPGMGYLHVPIANLDAAQATIINTKLDTSQFVTNQPTNPNYPLQNAGLSPLEGTILTANNYYAGNLSQTDQGGSAAAPPNSCTKNFLITLTDGLPSVDKTGVASANVANNLAGLTNQVAALKASTSNALTYVVGFALPYGVAVTQLDTIAIAGGTVHAYDATDTATLNSAFATIFNDILSKSSAASSVALNSQSVVNGANVFQAKFSSADWSGQLLNYPIQPNGTLGSAVWDAGQLINGLIPTSRVILTSKPSLSASAKGIAFRWPVTPASPTAVELDNSQIVALNTSATGTTDTNGFKRLEYLRGSSADEGASGLQFRKRLTSKLGDIVDSAPNFVGAPAFNYNDASYVAFRTANATRTPMIYVGANDGMLHGFDAGTGQEKIAYVPTGLFNKLTKLTGASYSHLYYVDGSPNSADVYYGNAWHTTLVSGNGNGARGIFALDVTAPSSFLETNANNLVNFEFNETNDADVGYVPGQATIVKLNNGKWGAIFGNGYNSSGTGQSTLFIVDIQTGALIKKISTGAGSVATPNALATPVSVDLDGDFVADVVYAGDLLGNMWKFDISDVNPVNWNVAYKLFQASQPITTAADVGDHPKGGNFVFFGTGKYLEATDISSVSVNTVYGIWDNGAAVSGNLVQQNVTSTITVSGDPYRTASNNSIDWSSNQGWYLNLPTGGERLVSNPVLHGGRIIFTSIIPSNAICSAGGTSWLNELNYLNGGQLSSPPLDTNGDGQITSADTLVAGRKLATIGSAPSIQAGFGTRNNPIEEKIINESSGNISILKESGNPQNGKRLSWQQIK